MAASLDIYAVVDKSKKKNHSPTEELGMEPASLVYDVATTNVDNKPVPEKNEGLYAEYSMLSFNPEEAHRVEQGNTNLCSKAIKTEDKEIGKQVVLNKLSCCRSLACIFPTIIAAIAILICIISIAYFSAEIAKLKTQTASTQQSPIGQQAEVNSSLTLQLLQQTLQNDSDAMKAQYINISMDITKLNNRTNQLGRLIDQLYQQISAIDNSTTQLGNLLDDQLNSTETMYKQLSRQLEYTTELLHNSSTRSFAISSCAFLLALSPSPSSGYYWVIASNGSVVRVFCDMTRSCGRVSGGWVRVGYLDMTDSSHQCPNGFTEHRDSNIRTCRRTNTSAGCVSVMIDVPYQYSRVCSRVRAYQVGSTNAFGRRSRSVSINSAYVDGVSFTHGLPKNHIWSFAAGRQEEPMYASHCPCINMQNTKPPSFVGNDYFCESGARYFVSNSYVYSADPLWDGDGCESTNNCCSFNNPPWFHKQLSQPTNDDIEMRVCTDEPAEDENVDIQMIEIYVQ